MSASADERRVQESREKIRALVRAKGYQTADEFNRANVDEFLRRGMAGIGTAASARENKE